MAIKYPTFRHVNDARDRAAAQEECRLAADIQRAEPGMTRPDALREAARILAARREFC
ncbi:MAG: hypothetical protein WCP53_15390 [Verrucomicrobiota bacterium]